MSCNPAAGQVPALPAAGAPSADRGGAAILGVGVKAQKLINFWGVVAVIMRLTTWQGTSKLLRAAAAVQRCSA